MHGSFSHFRVVHNNLKTNKATELVDGSTLPVRASFAYMISHKREAVIDERYKR